MSGEVDKSQHVLPLDQPVVYLEADAAFKGLTEKERKYAFHLSNAAWTGSLVTRLQTSVESAPLFVMLHRLFRAQSPVELRDVATKAGFADDEVTAFFVYAAGVFSYSGNYKDFGDLKFVPGLEKDRLEELLKLSPVWPSLEPLWRDWHPLIYELGGGRKVLGFPPHGCTTYVSKNWLDEDNGLMQEWLKRKGEECYMTRCFKTIDDDGRTRYEVRLAGHETKVVETEEHEGRTFVLSKGDYSALMKRVADHLAKAVPFAANETQAKMLECYVSSFMNGSLAKHKDGSRLWIKDKAPAVETYIGFIETYRDPAGVRGEFEGFVAAVNRDMSLKFTRLVDSAERLLTLLPWGKGFEKDTFVRPDFTSLDVLTFAGSGIPAGINIPNYDEIRQSEGFKNVALGNVIPASYQQRTVPFLSDGDRDLFQRYRVTSFEVQVGLHELLGHGSGKLLQVDTDGRPNHPTDLVDPTTGRPVASRYKPGETYDLVFGAMGSAYEECRAEAVGLYLSLEPSILEIFGHVGDVADDVVYVNWLSLVWAGLSSLEMWDPKRGWLQAHSQARFALMRVLIEAGVVTITQPKPDDLLITLDRSTFREAGRRAIGDFLLKLQVYKSTANIEAARRLFWGHTNVVTPWLERRDIVLANKRPRKMFAQPNLTSNESNIELKSYEPTPEGIIVSWVERFAEPSELYDELLEITRNDKQYFL